VELAGYDVDVHGTRSVVSLVDEKVDAVADGLRGGEPQPLCRARSPEEPLAGADDDRVDLKVEGVNEVVLDQRLDELRAAVNNDVAVVSLFELPDLGDDITGKDGGVVPFGVGQGLRDDVLGHGVELVRELALVARPDGSEAVVGDPAEQKGVRVHRLVELELVAFRAAAESVGPADALEALGSARRLDDAVDGHVLSDDDSSHVSSPFAVLDQQREHTSTGGRCLVKKRQLLRSAAIHELSRRLADVVLQRSGQVRLIVIASLVHHVEDR
jgi:hypothetical protein